MITAFGPSVFMPLDYPTPAAIPTAVVVSRIMDIKDRRHRSLTRGRCGKECRYTSSSLDSEDCRVPTQKSYSSSETLKAYDHDTRMHYGNRVSDLVHRESDEFPRQVEGSDKVYIRCYFGAAFGKFGNFEVTKDGMTDIA
ncbi:hypothetical protein BTVI_90527 [Pitangus sulphuratus]|nr:hypothetical protein BTVI_90527 [Pitangus sulphuratus]